MAPEEQNPWWQKMDNIATIKLRISMLQNMPRWM